MFLWVHFLPIKRSNCYHDLAPLETVKTPFSILQTKIPHCNFGNAGGGTEVAARALSLPDLNQAEPPTLPDGLESQERNTMEQEISQIDHMIDDMEMKVNVLRWMVEPHGPQYADPVSTTDSASMALFSVDEEQPGTQPLCQRSQIFVLLLLCAAVLVAGTLSVCVVFFS